MTTIHRIFALAVLGGLTTPLVPTDAQACTLASLPSADCNVDTTCCVAGALDDTKPGKAGSAARCDDVLDFEALKASCPDDDFDAHVLLFDMIEDTWADNGLRECSADLEFGKHWMAAQMIGGGIDFQPGITHHTGAQYLVEAQCNATTFHPQLDHEQSEAVVNKAALYTPDPSQANSIEFFCRAFQDSSSSGRLAGIFVHEAFHGTYGVHDSNDIQDWFFSHRPDDPPLSVEAEFVPDVWPFDGKPDKRQHSVYQLQQEFLCDLLQTPHDWVPRSGLFSVKSIVASIESKNVLNADPLPVWATCGAASPPLRSAKSAPNPEDPRTITIDLSGSYAETSEGGVDDDSGFFDQSVTMVVSIDNREAAHSEVIGPFADGELWLVVNLTAEMSLDNNHIDMTYDVEFHEDDADGTDCDEDFSGPNCPNPDDHSFWKPMVLSSTVTSGFAGHDMSNAATENGTDVAHIDLNFDLDW